MSVSMFTRMRWWLKDGRTFQFSLSLVTLIFHFLLFRLMRKRIWVKNLGQVSLSTWRCTPAPRPRTGFLSYQFCLWITMINVYCTIVTIIMIVTMMVTTTSYVCTHKKGGQAGMVTERTIFSCCPGHRYRQKSAVVMWHDDGDGDVAG